MALLFRPYTSPVASVTEEIDFQYSDGAEGNETPNCWCSVNCWDDPSTLRLFLSFMWLIRRRNGLRRWYMNLEERLDTVLHSTGPLAARSDNRCDTVDFIYLLRSLRKIYSTSNGRSVSVSPFSSPISFPICCIRVLCLQTDRDCPKIAWRNHQALL